MTTDEIARLRALCEKVEFDCQDNSCRFARKKDGWRTNGGCRCENGVLFMSTMSSVWKALPPLLAEIERLREAYRKIQCEYPGLTAMLDEVKYDNARLRKINNEAIRLLHMLDRAEARHPDVASFLDGLDPDAGRK